MYASLKLKDILTHLSGRVVKILEVGESLKHLIYLLEFLAAWAERPPDLTPVAYRWCSAIANAAEGLKPGEGTNTQLTRQRFRPQDLTSGEVSGQSKPAEKGFDNVGSGFDLFRGDVSPSGKPTDAALSDYTHLLSIALEIGFRRVAPSPDMKVPHSNRIRHHDWIFKNAFSSDDDEAIADALSMRILDDQNISLDSFVDYFAERMNGRVPSSRLREAAISTIERVGLGKRVGGLRIAQVLNNLNINEGDVVNKSGWATLLVEVIRSLAEPGDLSSHCWHLLDRLMLTGNPTISPAKGDLDVMESLRGAGKWGELGVWMVIMWSSPTESSIPDAKSVKRIEEVTRELLSQRSSVLQRYENLSKRGRLHRLCKAQLEQVCEQARVKRLPLTPP